jgi:deoxyribonuclease IV
MSIAGGVHTAIERALKVGCTTLQLFVKNNNRWTGKPLSDDEVDAYRKVHDSAPLGPIAAHDTYLINLCAVDGEILKKSRETLKEEFDRCERLGIDYLNFHPGSHMGAGEASGIERIAESLNRIHEQTRGYGVKSVLETTAGQGTAIGYRFEHLREIIERVEEKDRMAVCVDTCHVHAAGYDIVSEKGYAETMRLFDEIVGLERLVMFHVNDSKRERGSRVDRHEHIGRGTIGRRGFALLMNDTRFQGIPKILETPKGEEMKEDIRNMRILRSLLRR